MCSNSYNEFKSCRRQHMFCSTPAKGHKARMFSCFDQKKKKEKDKFFYNLRRKFFQILNYIFF